MISLSSDILNLSNVFLVLETLGIASGILVVYAVVKLLLYIRRMERCFKGVKTPKDFHWLFGTFTKMPKDDHGRAMFFIENANKYGKDDGYMMIWAPLRTPVIIPCCPDVMAKICKSNEPKPVGSSGIYKMIRPWLGEGLLVANGKKWARNRRLLTPAFHFEILKPYVNVFNKSADTLVAKLSKKAATGERFEVFQNVCLCTLEIILKCAFSYNKDVQSAGETNPYVQAVNRITDTLFYRYVRPYLHPDFLWYLSPTGRQFKKDCEYVHSVAEDVIDKRKETLVREGFETTKEKKYIDFLDILITAKDENGEGLTRLEIRNEVDTFLFEGHDTTASALSWVLYSLALNPDCQHKCQMEIDDILIERDSDIIEWSDLSKMEYVTMCIKEGLRLHSPVPIVNRHTQEEFVIGDRVFPKGILVQINMWVMNHMENLWGADHMEFKPERFSTENCGKIPTFQYVPFSAGPRNCIGQHFAMHEERVVLSKLLRNFTFTVDTTHKVRRSISAVMRTENGIYLFAEKRVHKTQT